MNEEVKNILEVFNRHFHPAQEVIDADELLTTQEILEKINNFYPGNESLPEEIFTALQDYGYRYDWVVDGFKWLLKSVR